MKKSETTAIVNAHSRDYWEHQILQWVHNETDRLLLKMQLLDGLSLNEITRQIQETHIIEYDMVKKRLTRAKIQLFSHMDSAE